MGVFCLFTFLFWACPSLCLGRAFRSTRYFAAIPHAIRAVTVIECFGRRSKCIEMTTQLPAANAGASLKHPPDVWFSLKTSFAKVIECFGRRSKCIEMTTQLPAANAGASLKHPPDVWFSLKTSFAKVIECFGRRSKCIEMTFKRLPSAYAAAS